MKLSTGIRQSEKINKIVAIHSSFADIKFLSLILTKHIKNRLPILNNGFIFFLLFHAKRLKNSEIRFYIYIHRVCNGCIILTEIKKVLQS